MQPKLYVYLNEDQIQSFTPLTEEKVKSIIYRNNPGLILPLHLTPELISLFNFKELIVTEIDKPPQDKLHLYSIEYGGIKKQGNDYSITIGYTFNHYKLWSEWDKIREKRQSLLSSSDWIVSSTLTTDECKLKYVAYRQCLRDIPEVFTDPFEVVFPLSPKVELDVKFTANTGELSEEEFQSLQNYKPAPENIGLWNKFLDHWKLTKFTKNKTYVFNSIITYMGQKFTF